MPNFSAASFLKVFAQHLKFNPGDENIQTKANNTVWWVSQQFCSGSLSLDAQMYAYQNFARPASLLHDFLDSNVKSLFGYTLYQHSVGFEHFWASSYDAAYQTTNGAINTDLIYNISDVMLAYTLWQDTAEERYRYMVGFKRYIDRFFTLTVGTNDGIKPDGTGFHHWTAYNNYMYAYNTAASLLSYLSGTRFQVERSNYGVFRNAFYAQYMQANDAGVQALAAAGRNPQNRMSPLSKSALKTLAIAGGDILGLSTADPVFAGLYNRIYGVDAAFNYSTVTPFELGFFEFNHASAGAFRKDGWVVFNKGFTNNMWGAELYPPQNRYGRYQSYGALEVIYPGNKETGNGYNVDTWDWNYNPGATVIKLPWAKLHGERARIDEMQQKRFVGTLNLKNKSSELLTNGHGNYGMFAMDFKEQTGQGFNTTFSSENHNNTFAFKKSNFYFDDFIVCLGSGISNNDASNTTITTLYQRLDNKGTSPNVNGAGQSSTGEVAFAGNSDQWVLSNYNTGFYLLSGNHSLKVKKEAQQTPNQNQVWPVNYSGNPTATYYTGYIDHGTKPSDKNYEYILKPNSNIAEMQALETAVKGGNKPYTVHQQNANAHIVEHKSKNVWGYAFFNAASNVSYDKVKGVNASCLVMTEYSESAKTLLLSVVEPDLGFTSRSSNPSPQVTKQITLQGEWALSKSYSGVSVTSSSESQTVLLFELKDGLSKEVLLESTEAVLDPFSPVGKWGVIDEGTENPTVLSIITTDGDNGDGFNDGAVLVDGKSVVDPQGAKFTFDETMTAGGIYKAATTIFKHSSSYSKVKLQLYNVTDDVLLASSDELELNKNGKEVVNASVTYQATASDAGKILQIRWVRVTPFDAYRDFAIDFASINTIEIDTKLLSVENKKHSRGVTIYPNPSSSLLNIKLNANVTIKNITVMDVTGKEIFKQNNAASIDVRSFAKGLYFLKIQKL